MDDRFKSVLETEWRKRQSQSAPPALPADPTPGWHYELTAAYYYAYATRFSFSVANATYVAAPWARIRVDRDGAVTFEPLPSEILEIGIQGMWPLDEEALAAWGLSESAQNLLTALRALPKGEESAHIRTFYRVWVRGNGQIANALRPYHARFFRWLADTLSRRVSSRIAGLWLRRVWR